MAVFALTTTTDNLTGTAGSDEFRVRGGTLNATDIIDGGDGFDVLRVVRADFGVIDLSLATITGFERLQGSNPISVDSGNDTFRLDAAVLVQFAQIDGGGGYDTIEFKGESAGATDVFDLTGKSVSNIEAMKVSNGELILTSSLQTLFQSGSLALTGSDGARVTLQDTITSFGAARIPGDVLKLLNDGFSSVKFHVSVTNNGVTADVERVASLSGTTYTETSTDPSGSVLGSFVWSSVTRTLDVSNSSAPVLIQTFQTMDDGSTQQTDYDAGIKERFFWDDVADAYSWDTNEILYSSGLETFRITIQDSGVGEFRARQAGLVVEGRDGQSDVLFGVSGADTFVFGDGAGSDRIHVFQAAVDMLDLRGHGLTSVEELVDLAVAGVGAQTVIDFGDGDVLTIGGIRVNQLASLAIIFDSLPIAIE